MCADLSSCPPSIKLPFVLLPLVAGVLTRKPDQSVEDHKNEIIAKLFSGSCKIPFHRLWWLAFLSASIAMKIPGADRFDKAQIEHVCLDLSGKGLCGPMATRPFPNGETGQNQEIQGAIKEELIKDDEFVRDLKVRREPSDAHTHARGSRRLTPPITPTRHLHTAHQRQVHQGGH